MEKLICGKVILFQEKCPNCGEHNLSSNRKFYCTNCENEYASKLIHNTRRVSNTQKEGRIAHAVKKQSNKCYYCEHEFGKLYSRNNKPSKLFPLLDMILPLDLKNQLQGDEDIAICNICNQYRGSRLQFESFIEQKQWLKYMWQKEINLGKLNFH